MSSIGAAAAMAKVIQRRPQRQDDRIGRKQSDRVGHHHVDGDLA
jgi:hypothetical protein